MFRTDFTPAKGDTSSQASSDNKSEEKRYFDLIVPGVGYLNRHRWVPTNNGKDKYLAVSIMALEGDRAAPNKVPFDLTVKGEGTIQVVDMLESEINDKDTKVLVCFKAGIRELQKYEQTKGQNAGQEVLIIKGNLIRIQSIRIKRKGQSEYEEVYNEKWAESESEDTKQAEAA